MFCGMGFIFGGKILKHLPQALISSNHNHLRRKNAIQNNCVILNMKNIIPSSVVGKHPASLRVYSPKRNGTTWLI